MVFIRFASHTTTIRRVSFRRSCYFFPARRALNTVIRLRNRRPLGMALAADKFEEFPICGPVFAPFDADRHAVYQGVGNRLSRLLNDSAKGGPGNPHMLSGRFMGKPHKICKPQCLIFVNGQRNLRQPPQRYAPGFKIRDIRVTDNISFFLWSWHNSFMSIYS